MTGAASDSKSEIATCAGKHAFPSPIQAKKASQRMAHGRKNKSFKADSYRCKFCGRWHVGSKAK